jgi:hypothetical protein
MRSAAFETRGSPNAAPAEYLAWVTINRSPHQQNRRFAIMTDIPGKGMTGWRGAIAASQRVKSPIFCLVAGGFFWDLGEPRITAIPCNPKAVQYSNSIRQGFSCHFCDNSFIRFGSILSTCFDEAARY